MHPFVRGPLQHQGVQRSAEQPVHGEAFHEADTRLKTGDFVGQNGQRYYYRMRLSDEGEAPYGPEWFEVSLRPLRDE